MQDSLEDYIRISKNCKEDEDKFVRKDVLITAQRKRESDNRAKEIVEFLIEGKLRTEVFIKCLPFIDQTHYQDIVEERAIGKLCGYAICGKLIPEMPKKQFHISTRNNKVYDITDRKNYCSNFCYKASIHLKNQVETSPLWLRKIDDIKLKQFNLLPKTDKGLPGMEVDQGVAKPTKIEDKDFTSVSAFAHISLDVMEKKEIKKSRNDKNQNTNHKTNKQEPQMETIIEENSKIEEEETKEELVPSPSNVVENSKIKEEENEKKIVSSPSNVVDNSQIREEDNKGKVSFSSNVEENSKIRKEETKEVVPSPSISEEKLEIVESKEIPKPINNKIDKNKKTNKKKQNRYSDIGKQIKQSLREWLTLETIIYIYGEDKMKTVLTEHKLIKYFDDLKIAELRTAQQIKYIEICRKLQLKELADEQFDNAVLNKKILKPIPDYRQLKEEAKRMELKVKSFYSGQYYIQEDTNFPVTNEEETPEESKSILPLTDNNSQIALRRKIYLNSLKKTMQDLLESLELELISVLPEIQSLVKTFKLNAKNVTFRPTVWNYIAIVLLKILSLKNGNLRDILNSEKAQNYLESQLSSLPNKMKFLDEIILEIENVDMFIENYITCQDVCI